MYLAPCSHGFFSHVSHYDHIAWEKTAGLCASRLFVCLSCMRYVLSFSLPLDVGGWLRIAMVALPVCFV